MSESLRDLVGRALYEELPGGPTVDWSLLNEERREPWRKDADRVIPIIQNDARRIDIDFGFASFADRSFELIARDRRTGAEITLYGSLRPDQSIEQIDRVLPTCVYARGLGRRAYSQTEDDAAQQMDNGRNTGGKI